ncbi:MAG: amidohydrolase family protein [archaeon]|nr:amidohydrolase family protein [archaeon]
MQKVVNTHCHIYPNKIASKAVESIGDFYDLAMALDGTIEGLIEDGKKIGTVHYLVHSVATSPKQVKSINEFIADNVKQNPDLFTGFGTLHPDSEDVEADVDYIIELGLKGVKLHPDFQQFALNEERSFKLAEAVDKNNLPMLIHCGDFRYNYSNPTELKELINKFPNLTIIGAHFAGWSIWEKSTAELAGTPNLYVDVSSSLYGISPETAKELIYAYGVDKVLFGTDFPMWDSVSEMERFKKIGLTQEEEYKILYENAAKLLNLI